MDLFNCPTPESGTDFWDVFNADPESTEDRFIAPESTDPEGTDPEGTNDILQAMADGMEVIGYNTQPAGEPVIVARTEEQHTQPAGEPVIVARTEEQHTVPVGNGLIVGKKRKHGMEEIVVTEEAVDRVIATHNCKPHSVPVSFIGIEKQYVDNAIIDLRNSIGNNWNGYSVDAVKFFLIRVDPYPEKGFKHNFIPESVGGRVVKQCILRNGIHLIKGSGGEKYIVYQLEAVKNTASVIDCNGLARNGRMEDAVEFKESSKLVFDGFGGMIWMGPVQALHGTSKQHVAKYPALMTVEKSSCILICKTAFMKTPGTKGMALDVKNSSNVTIKCCNFIGQVKIKGSGGVQTGGMNPGNAVTFEDCM
jgi:hypothetical protein